MGYTRRFWLHCPNNRPLDHEDFAAFERIKPGGVVVCQPYFDQIDELRTRLGQNLIVVGRFYGSDELGISAWNPPYTDESRMREYGRYCAREATYWDVDFVQWANEPSIESAIPPDPDGFRILERASRWWLEGFTSVPSNTAESGTIPLAPGNREDDDGGWGYRGADFLAPAFASYSALLLHNYWTCDAGSIQSEWWGYRNLRQMAAYGWSGKPVIITEFNRDPACADRPLGDDVRRWFDGLSPAIAGAAWFIWDSNDVAFRAMRMKYRPDLIDAAIAINAAGETAMPIVPTAITYLGPAQFTTGQNITRFRLDGIDGPQAVITVKLQLPLRPDGVTAYTIDPFGFTRVTPDGNGSGEGYVNLVVHPFEADGPVYGELVVNTLEILPSPTVSLENVEGREIGRFPVKVYPASVPPSPPPPPPSAPDPVPGLRPEYDIAWNLAGDLVNAGNAVGDSALIEAGSYVHAHIKHLKGEGPRPNPLMARR